MSGDKRQQALDKMAENARELGLDYEPAQPMTVIEWIKKLFARVPPAVTDEHCPYCQGLGYDSSGFTCSCLREKT